jgi:hypothetical protein
MISIKGVAGMAGNKTACEQGKDKEPDGMIGERREWENANPKVLYVALAPNWEKDDKYRDCFWIQEVVYGNADDNGSRILKWLLTEQCKIENKEAPKWEKDYQILKKAAFMNLSKRGCKDGNYEKCVDDYLQNDKHRDEIIKQFQDLNPDIIFCYNEKVLCRVVKLLEKTDMCPKFRLREQKNI